MSIREKRISEKTRPRNDEGPFERLKSDAAKYIREKQGTYSDKPSKMKLSLTVTTTDWAGAYLEGDVIVLALDGPHTRFSKECYKRWIARPENIYCPQMDAAAYRKMKDSGRCQPIFGEWRHVVENVLPEAIMEKMNLIAADWQNSPFGNSSKKIYPLHNTYLALKKTKRNKVVLSFTSPERLGADYTSGNILFEDSEDLGDQIERYYLVPMIHMAKYRISNAMHVRYRQDRYSAWMWFFLFYLEKDLAAPQPELVVSSSTGGFEGYDPEDPEFAR